jgi:hypothetical protein
MESKLGPLGTSVTSGILYQPRGIVRLENLGGMKIDRENRRTRRKPAPAPLCPPQIQLTRPVARTWAAAVGSQRLTAWAMARPNVPIWSPTVCSVHVQCSERPDIQLRCWTQASKICWTNWNPRFRQGETNLRIWCEWPRLMMIFSARWMP